MNTKVKKTRVETVKTAGKLFVPIGNFKKNPLKW